MNLSFFALAFPWSVPCWRPLGLASEAALHGDASGPSSVLFYTGCDSGLEFGQSHA